MSNFIAFSLIALARRKKYHKHTKRVIETILFFRRRLKKEDLSRLLVTPFSSVDKSLTL